MIQPLLSLVAPRFFLHKFGCELCAFVILLHLTKLSFSHNSSPSFSGTVKGVTRRTTLLSPNHALIGGRWRELQNTPSRSHVVMLKRFKLLKAFAVGWIILLLRAEDSPTRLICSSGRPWYFSANMSLTLFSPSTSSDFFCVCFALKRCKLTKPRRWDLC